MVKADLKRIRALNNKQKKKVRSKEMALTITSAIHQLTAHTLDYHPHDDDANHISHRDRDIFHRHDHYYC